MTGKCTKYYWSITLWQRFSEERWISKDSQSIIQQWWQPKSWQLGRYVASYLQLLFTSDSTSCQGLFSFLFFSFSVTHVVNSAYLSYQSYSHRKTLLFFMSLLARSEGNWSLGPLWQTRQSTKSCNLGHAHPQSRKRAPMRVLQLITNPFQNEELTSSLSQRPAGSKNPKWPQDVQKAFLPVWSPRRGVRLWSTTTRGTSVIQHWRGTAWMKVGTDVVYIDPSALILEWNFCLVEEFFPVFFVTRQMSSSFIPRET